MTFNHISFIIFPYNMYLKIWQIDLVPDKYGKFIKITKIWLYSNEWKFEKRITLDNPLVVWALKNVKFGTIEPTETTIF